MADTSNCYDLSYRAAISHFNDNDNHRAVEHAKTSLRDPTLPRYWQAKNCILIICAAETWYEAEIYRMLAEDITAKASEVTAKLDRMGAIEPFARGCLRELRTVSTT